METTGCWSQLGLVMWRQVWLTRVRRHYLVTLLELTCMVFMLSSVWEESAAPYRARPNKDQFFDSADAIEFWGRPNESWNEGTLAFAPDQAFFADLTARVCKELGSKWTPMPFKDAHEAAQYVEAPDGTSSETTGQERRVAVWFERPETDQLTYHVRIRNAVFDLRDDYKRSLLVPGAADIDLQDEIRLLLPLQYFIESAYIQMIAESLQKPINVKVELMRFPYPRLFYGSEDHTLSLVSLRFAISFFVPFCLLVVKLVKEKRVGVKEMLRRAGLSDVAYWMGHFFESGFVVLCAVLLMYVPLFVIPNGNGTAFIEFANPVVIMAVLLLFGVLTILHAMLLSVFLWGPGVAFAAAVVYWFALCLLPYAQLQNPFGLGYYLISRSTKLISALSPVMYLHWCLRVIERFEKYEVRLTWRNIFDSGTTLDNVSVGELCLLSLSAALVLVGLIWYLDNVVPWGYGVPKPFYFIFSTDYWSPYRKWNIRNMNYAQDKSYFEADPKNADAIVHLLDLSATNKATGDLKNIILTIYNKQITVILGPQDCGHVTLLDIITGRQLPTSGEAYVCNFDASSLSGRAWEYLSVCPEERELFDDMTVEEHLLFFLFLRLVPVNTGEAYVAMLMRQLNIEHYKDTLVSALPPRVKRVVCVAITACAVEQTPLVIFPDPTRLMDPKGRHQVWEVLARLSRRSSVLVTTKSIEEAEILADRLVIMREGSVVCAGSPTWLKTRFDSGFFLRFTKLPNFRERDVTRVVKYHMGAVAPRRVSKLETVYNLSDSLHHVPRMATMLHYLEKRHDILGIAFMSLTYCTLEDVYIRMVSGLEGNMGGGDTQAQSPATPADGSDPAKEKQEQDAVRQWCTARSTKAGVFSVLWALLRKRGIIWLRVWWTKPLSLGIPVACMLLLALCERHFLPDIAWEGSDITYEPEHIFDDSYGFIEKDNATKKFAENVLLPVLSEHSVRVFSPASSFVERELLFWAQQNFYSYLYEYQYGVSILGDKRAVVWFNGQCPHSAPISLNLFHTALLRNLTGHKGSRITLVNSPDVRKAEEAKIEFETRYGQLEPLAGHEVLGHELELFSTRNLITRVLYSFFVSLAMGFYAATHVFTPMVEWCSGIKHLQLMTGMSGCLYWMGHFVFDAIEALCNSATLASIIFVSNMDIDINYHLAILFLFVTNAFASLPLTYLFTGLFGDTTWAFSFLALVLFFAGMVGSLGVELLRVITQDHPTVVSSAALFLWGFVCRWFPTYALVRGIIKVLLLSRLNAICLTGGELLGEACRDSQYSTDKRISRCCDALLDNTTARLLYPLEPFYETGFYEAVSMVVEGMLYMIALALVDSPLMYSLRWYVARRMYGSDEPDDALDKQQHGPRLIAASMDPEVEREVNLVNQVCRTRAFKDVAMAVRNIQKVTGYVKQVDEVDGVSILLNRCECLGLIGVNNSGKTSLLEILVGIQVPSGGGAYTAALSLGGDLRAWQQGIGYAPDGIAEWCMPQLTVGEFLDLMAHLRGVAWRRQALRALLELTGRLREEQMIEKCGHGELKMLLIAAAAIGVPPVMLLDEPYSDVEPLYRNEIIHMLQLLKSSQATSIIMTSHRMTHCEVLCDRVGVMEAGKIEALGDALQMNQKYGRSYMVTLRLPLDKRFDYYFQRSLIDLMQEEFHQCNFNHNYKGMMSFTVGKTYTSWSELFTKMVAIKNDQELPEFSISDITLENIFVGLARRQILITGVRPHNFLSGVPSHVGSPRR